MNKELEQYCAKEIASGVQSAHSKRLRLIPGGLNASALPRDMDSPGLHLQRLRGKYPDR